MGELLSIQTWGRMWDEWRSCSSQIRLQHICDNLLHRRAKAYEHSFALGRRSENLAKADARPSWYWKSRCVSLSCVACSRATVFLFLRLYWERGVNELEYLLQIWHH